MNTLVYCENFIHWDIVKIFNKLPQSILIKDSRLNFVAANQKAAQLTGFKKSADMIGLNDSQLNCAASSLHEEITRQDRSVLATDNQFFLDIGYYPSKHCLKILYTSKIKIDDEQNRTFVLVSTTDIPIKSISSALFNIIQSSKDPKWEVQSYQIQTANYPFKITHKQSECLFYILRGKTSKEIAILLNRSPRTIEDHINELKYKFNCQTKSQLIEQALQLGFSQIIPASLLAL
ncbi:LuxR C-terminal-related transcriptional regulator [Legionella sp. W05-934-2]|jgi:DNA-binding CsgD family transcriptional regulator|uniref:LuxR C-terminal-related transcriptional regulator n=1 Tax=Legionella sp. W05-934-2 TaxID=1198649 RepID=UPI0034632EB5